jgi:hypothetical protein
MSNIKKSNVFKNDITDSWSQLLETDTEFAEDLIKYSYLISGFNNSISQFHEFIPYQWFNRNRFNSYLKSNIRNLKDTDTNFINQFFRNNLSDNTLSTEVYNNQLSRTDNSFIYVKGEHLDTETKPYMVRRNVMLDEFSGDKEMRYYKLEGQSGQDFIYTRVLPLGYKDNKGNKFVEYNNSNDYRNDNPLISIFDSNKINNYNFEQVKEFTKLFNPVEDVNTEEDNYMEQYDREESFNISNPNVGLDETLDFDNSQEFVNNNMREYTPENITSLKENEVFVFGSNAEGAHGKGAALLAKQKFGAKQGQSEGLQGQSYAIITKKDWRVEKSSTLEEIGNDIMKFVSFASQYPDKKFYVTKIGSALAGYTLQEIKQVWEDVNTQWESEIFSDIPDNIILPKEYEVRDNKSQQLSSNELIATQPTQSSTSVNDNIIDELWNSNKDLLEANGMNEESFNQMYNEFGEDSILEYIKKCKGGFKSGGIWKIK